MSNDKLLYKQRNITIVDITYRQGLALCPVSNQQSKQY
jgi:hypothetical protein